ncbi:PAS domain S-box protein [Labilibacter sediminis]|nr:PAS domain S-box protein [Labilibacter sediminis]
MVISRKNLIGKNVFEIQELLEKITNTYILLLTIFLLPLFVFVVFIRGSIMLNPLSLVINSISIGLLLICSVFNKRVAFYLKRIVLSFGLLNLGLRSLAFGDLDMTLLILAILATYLILALTKRELFWAIVIIISLSFVFTLLVYFNIIQFYYNPNKFSYNVGLFNIRTFVVILVLSMLLGILFYVFNYLKSTISQLKVTMDEILDLNKSLTLEIDERKKSEQLAKENANKYLSLFNNSNDTISITSSSHEILEINNSFLKLVGYDREDMINKNIFDYIGHNYKQLFAERRKKILTNKNIPDITIKVLSKNGNTLYLQIQTVPIISKQETNFLTIAKDVTEQHIITEELSKREQLYRTLFEQTNDSILIMNGDKVVDFNQRALEIYGSDESIDKIEPPYQNLESHFEQRDLSVDLGKRVKETLNNKSQFFEWKHTKESTNELIYTLVQLKKIDLLGPQYYMVVENDISERKKTQDAILNSIIQTEEKERKRIASDLHDGIGPLLTTIKLYVQALMDSTDEEKSVVIRNKLSELVDEAITSISEISFNISPHILLNYGLIPAINSFIEKFNLTSKLDIQFTQSGITRFNEHQEITLYRVFTELMNNTLKYSQATEVTINIQKREDQIEFLFSDNGIGFDPKEVANRKTSMGIKNFKRRINSFNGVFELYSQPNKGMSVKIVIPQNN